MRRLEDFSSKERRALTNFQDHSIFKIGVEEYWWDVFSDEILPRLPTKDLQKLKCVCKNWYRIISSPNFVALHLKIYNQSRIRVMIPAFSVVIEYKYKINCDEESKLRILYPLELCKSIILGSCDGLLCLSIEHRTAVYNPSTGKYFIVETPSCDSSVICYWFGRHPTSGEHLLVLVNLGWDLEVYNFTRSDFRPIQYASCFTDPRFVLESDYCRGTLLHGAVHWPAMWLSNDEGEGEDVDEDEGDHNDDDDDDVNQPRHIICAYHLEDNKFLEISPPVQCDFNVGVVEGCLFAILKPTTNAEFEMWIMKEYGVHQSWTKYATIEGFNNYGVMFPLGFFPNGDLILDVDASNVVASNIVHVPKLIKYSFKDNKAVLLKKRHSHCRTIICDDSLVSPTIVKGGV